MPPLWFRSVSLRTKILGVAVGTVLLLGASAALFVRDALQRALLDQLGSRGLAIARSLAASAVTPALTERFVDLDLMFRESMRSDQDIAYIFILSPRGEVLAHTFSGGFPSALKAAGAAAGPRRLATERGNVLDIAAPVLGGDLGVLRLGMSEDAVRREVQQTVGAIVWIVVACTLAASGLAILLALMIAGPLGDLADAADEVRDGRFPEAVEVAPGDEVGRLAAAFNAMVVGRQAADKEQVRLIAELQQALADVRTLEGLLPICASCKKIRDEQGSWNQIEAYISEHADVQFSHGLCPECLRSRYPQLADTVEARLALVPPPPRQDAGGY